MPFDGLPAAAKVLEKPEIVFLGAMRELLAGGWCQWASCVGTHYCIMGAYDEIGENGSCTKAMRLLADELCRGDIDTIQPTDLLHCELIITGWNDEPWRTKEEVLDLFDRTIIRAQKESRDAV